MDNFKKVTKKELIEKISDLSKEFNIEVEKTKGDKKSLVQEYQRILLLIETQKSDKPAEEVVQILSKKDAKKSLRDANKKVKSISGLIRLIKAFEVEYRPSLQAYGIDIDKLSPKYIADLWKAEYKKDGKLIEDYKKKNPLYSEAEDIKAQSEGRVYNIPTHIPSTRVVENFTVNKLIKYAGK